MLTELERATVRNMRERLEMWLVRANSWERTQAMLWYRKANDVAVFLSAEYDITMEQAAAVLSVLSPGCPWEQNMTDANNVCQAWKQRTYDATVNTYGPQLGKAYRILDKGKGKNAQAIEKMIGKKAPKTKAFYWNILEPEKDTQVTIDRWILRALGMPVNRTTPQLYKLGSEAIRQVARKYQVLPQTMQALVWVVIRRCGAELNVTMALPGF